MSSLSIGHMKIACLAILAVSSAVLAGCVMTPPNCDYTTSTQRMRCLQDREQIEKINADRQRARRAKREGASASADSTEEKTAHPAEQQVP